MAAVGTPLERAEAMRHPMLSGNWAPVSDETRAEGVPVDVVQGTLPADIDGVFLRIGPNSSRPEDIDPSTYHFFSADGMVHSVELRHGTATYRRKFVHTQHYLTGSDDLEERTGLANTAMVFHAGRLLCLEEGGKPYHMALPCLETVGPFTFGGKLQHNFTAHPKVCPATGELIFFGYGAHQVKGSDAFFHYSVASKEGELLRTVPIHFRKPIMIHDFAVTRNYSILLDFPLWTMTGPTRVEDRSLFGVMPRHAKSETEITWFDTPGQYAYHVANAWEKGGSGQEAGTVIEVVLCSALAFDFRRSNTSSLKLHKFAFDLLSGKMVEDVELSAVPCEFPVVDARVVGAPTRFIWASRFARGVKEALAVDGIVRYDMHEGTLVELVLPGGRRGGEVQFIPRCYSGPSRSEEGDGYLLMHAFCPSTGAAELMVFDAMSMSPEPVAILGVPMRVPYGFHALWVPAERYDESAAAKAIKAKL